jgi:predicted nucleic acid-binding protein
MTVLAFVDANIIVYAIGRDTDRREKAIRLITDGAVVSAQVINEMISVLVGKQKFAKLEAYEIAQSLLDLCEVVPVDKETISEAMRLAIRYSLSTGMR